MKVQSINRTIDAEQYLEGATNWHAMRAIVPEQDMEERLSMETDAPALRITYDDRDFYLDFGDWVVRYPDGSLHFFKKATFDELYQNPFTEPLAEDEIKQLLEVSQ